MNSTSTTKLLAAAVTVLAAVAPATAIQTSIDAPSHTNMFQDSQEIYSVQVTNNEEQAVEVRIYADIGLETLIQPQTVQLAPGEKRRVSLILNSSETSAGAYSGVLNVETQNDKDVKPLSVRVLKKNEQEATAEIQTSSNRIRPDQELRVFTVITSASRSEIPAKYEVRNSNTGEVLTNHTTSYTVEGTKSFTQNLSYPGEYPLDDYYVQADFQLDNKTISATDTFQVRDTFWTPLRFKIMIFLVAVSIVAAGGVYTRRWYIQHKEEESRYVFPVDYSKLPEESEDNYWVGKVAESSKSAYIDPDDLTTHAIVSGSTGSGKSVTANVIAEEALEADVPVVVFDPTAQWTGFVKELKDDNLLEHYDRFDMDPQEDTHPYPGIIKEVTSSDPDIDFQELKQPGEITVFTLDSLTTEEFDDAVRSIIDQIFEEDWEESPTLEMLVVFDEVHRLLEEYGGEGGYQALEKGAREFRKWGVGLMMCSQVTADFKQAISGNIMTEVQLQTKSMEDIDRVEKKYGEEFAKRISSEDVGTGMIQNSNYNEGDPWFVDFRPTYHNPHRITDEEMEKYHELSNRLDNLKQKVKEAGKEEDKQLELNLASDKLKEGRFKMAKMYISSLEDEMNIS